MVSCALSEPMSYDKIQVSVGRTSEVEEHFLLVDQSGQ